MVSDFTLTRQRENIAGLEFGCGGSNLRRCWVAAYHRLKSVPLERLPARESGLNVVPPFKLIAFVGLPTEQHDSAVAHRRKID
jgi:hypothetical protein